MKTCGPGGRDCIEKNSAETFNCSTTCEGMYADISQKAEMPKFDGRIKGKDKKKFFELFSQYTDFKKENVNHIRFSSEASFFGKQILR